MLIRSNNDKKGALDYNSWVYMQLYRDYVGEITPYQCRAGPFKDQKCTDFYCCVLYLVMVGLVVFFSLLSLGGNHMTLEDLKLSLQETSIGGPFYSIIEAVIPIIVSLGLIAVICIFIVFVSFTVPVLITLLYVPALLLFMLCFGVAFILRFFNIPLPFVPTSIQLHFAKSYQPLTIIVGVGFIVGFLLASGVLGSKRGKFTYIQPLLRIARTAFWANPHLLLFSFLFATISISTLIANITLLSICLTRQDYYVSPATSSTFIIIETLWTHGLLEALSEFFFQSVAIHWYYKKRREEDKLERWCGTLLYTFKSVGRHLGTISFGSINAYLPETINTMINKVQGGFPGVYCICCFWHSFIRELSKYGYIQTIMQSLDFCQANTEMMGLRQRTKKRVPNLYMIGNFYITLARVCTVMISLVICYFLIGNSELAHIQSNWNFLGPIVVVFLGGLQISSHFMNATGLVGDTLVFMYSMDIEIEKSGVGEPEPYNCPNKIRDIIYEVKAGKDYIK